MKYIERLEELKIWNEFAGCFDLLPTIDDCKQMRDAAFCPYPSCADYPCWEFNFGFFRMEELKK